MKRITLACMAAVCCLSWGTPVMAEGDIPPSASTELFDFTPFNDREMLELFLTAQENGRKYPTEAEFEAAGFNLIDLEFARSHVRPRAILKDKSKNLYPNIYENRNLWMNIPMGVGKAIGGYPSSTFSDDTYSMWNYTNLFGSWNHGLFQAPGSWVDAAHKNGTDIFSGIKFFESWTPGSESAKYREMITAKNPDGSFKYAEAFINCLMFFGTDGINYNWEDTGYADADVMAFHKELYKIAEREGFKNFHIGIYTSNSTLSQRNVDALYGTKETGKTADLMLNYAGGDFSYGIRSSVGIAEANYGNADGVYTGVWIVSMDRRWSALNENESAKKAGVCLWGEHGQSRFMSYNVGATSMEFQSNYQKLLERTFSGGNRNPANLLPVSNTGNNWEQDGDKEPLESFCGLATFIPERTAIQGDLPFNTFFSLGNGERYNYKGKKTFASWYNIGAQDVVPTYRWLVYDAGTTTVSTKIQPSFTHEDAYIGGSALRLEGSSTDNGTDIVLYRSKLKVSGTDPVVKVALKSGATGTEPSRLYVILKKENNDQWFEYAVGETNGPTWEEKQIALAGFSSNDVIEYIGFRVKGAYAGNYNMLVGKLELSDSRIATPANIKSNSLVVEVKEETTKSLSLKLNWAVDPTGLNFSRANWGLLYNDEANIDHFEIMYKNGENGKISEIARTTGWSGFAGNIVFEGDSDEPYVGVRSASVDFKTYSPIQWVKVERSTSPNLPAPKDNTYCESVVNPAAEGVDIAREQRYVESFTTTGADQNLDYHASAPQPDGTQYVNATDHVLKVKQGQTITLSFKAYDTSTLSKVDGLRFCFAKGYMDLDKSDSFEPDGDELLFDLGTVRKGTPEFETVGYTKEFTIPADAAVGKSRLRVVFSDAWFAHPGPCGQTAKGFSIDFGVEITGDNPQRPVAPDLHDQGEADEPDRVRDEDPTTPPSGVENIKEGYAGFSKCWMDPAENVIFFQDVERAWIYTTTGQLVKYVIGNPESLNVAELTSGVYIVKMEYNNVIRSQKLLKQ